MRFLTQSAIIVAILSTAFGATNATAQDATKVAVVDVAYIFKNHPGIKAQVERVEADLKAYDAEFQRKREELKNEAEALKGLKPGTPDYGAQEEKVASKDSMLRLDMARKRKELADAEARIYFQNYQTIAAGVKYLAEYYKIQLVLRYNSEDMDLEKGDSVIRGVMKNIVYHHEDLDMTGGVMEYLNKVMKVADQGGGQAPRKQ